MTLKQAIDIACTYAGEKKCSFSEAMLIYYADAAQKEIALNVSRIVKRYSITKPDTKEVTYTLPSDSIGFFKIIRRGSALPVRFSQCGEKLVISDYGCFDVYYHVLPETLSHSTPDSYTFEVETRAHGAIPFYIASCIASDNNIAEGCKNEWTKLNKLVKQNSPKPNDVFSGRYFGN